MSIRIIVNISKALQISRRTVFGLNFQEGCHFGMIMALYFGGPVKDILREFGSLQTDLLFF